MESDFFTRPNLKTRGWTDALIKKFMKDHDTTCPNPMYIHAGSPMKLYRQDRVKKIEATEEFHQERKKAENRKKAAAKAVRTKLDSIKKYLDNLTIEVPKLDREALLAAAKKNWYAKSDQFSGCPSDEKMCVNYLRHCLTNYEEELSRIYKKTGSIDAYYDIKEKVLDAIEDQYEWLEEECWDQWRQMNQERSQRDCY